MTPTRTQIATYLAAARAIADTIKENSPAPIRPMYAAAMSRMSLETFNGMVRQIAAAGLIELSAAGTVATWIGPK